MLSCSDLQEQVICEVSDLIFFDFSLEVMCDQLRSAIAGRVPRSPDMEVCMTEEVVLFAKWEHGDS